VHKKGIFKVIYYLNLISYFVKFIVIENCCLMQEIICATVGTTIKFNLDNDGWLYLLCNHCNKRTYETGSFKCTYCEMENVMPIFKYVNIYLCHLISLHIVLCCYNFGMLFRYRLQLQVCDDSCNFANFVVWDQECRNIIGISAANLQNKWLR